MNKCHKCGALRDSFEEMYAHLCGCTGLPQAIETTASPSETAADKGILTEEELKETVSYIKRNRESIYKDVAHSLLEKIENSHRAIQERNRNLVLENDELLAENTKLKHAAIKVKQHLEGVTHPKRLIMLDCPWMVQTLNKALEELK